MLGDSTEKKMVLISSTTNEWPQQNEHQGMNTASAETRAMEKQTQQQQMTQESLKCPRCDSSNTKFCYYNNYSLSQPRHFCKACKRYWTRGGTLRNVPVGGGCRRNKKIRRLISAVDLPSSSLPSPSATSSNPNTTPTQINPVFFGFHTNPNPSSEMGIIPYSNFNPRVSSAEAVLGFEPQMSGFGLGFSNHDGNYQNGSTNQVLSSYNSLFGSSSTNLPTIASLLGSSLNQQKLFNNINGGFQGLGSFEEVQMSGNMSMKVKREEGHNYQNPNFQNHLEQDNPSDSTYWNATNIGAWLDPTNIGSSIPSMI